MRMIRWCLAVLWMWSAFAGAQIQGQLPGEIRLASEVWEGYTEADGTGLGWDVMRKVFEPAGVRLSIHSVPYMRAVGLVQRDEADAWVGSYRDEVEGNVLYPTHPYDTDQIVALSLKDKPVPTLDSLSKYRLVWVRGYGYEEYLPNVRDYREVQRRSGILGMLDLGHADFYIDARPEVDYVLSQAAKPQQYRATDLMQLPLYLGFADTPRGRALAELYDRRMAALIVSGELRPVFARWRQPYPFD
ncbi:ABC transporter substrate-binding protein [Ectopseudomonas mendocina]|jgi:polar amino acid transport system substrate-binding protein|uniref:ABC transporter substrate-binding protein n=1 Tax=Ectopseudomonas mendocina TaxID=300 RepID=A0A2R3QQ71_ECTME|nr:transporter substrate-binding domain-containing protein [Pseudomonas mendocina]AVO53926.1 ABC transporter substrate-binding protein [Pseudomonas mendocina]